MPDLLVDNLDGRGLQPKVFVGDTDTALVLRLFDLSSGAFDPLKDPTPPPLDVSGATPLVDLIMRFSKPPNAPGDPLIVTDVGASFTTATLLPGFTGTGTDGYIEFRTPSGFLDRRGFWRREGIVTLTPGKWSSDIVDFEVFATL